MYERNRPIGLVKVHTDKSKQKNYLRNKGCRHGKQKIRKIYKSNNNKQKIKEDRDQKMVSIFLCFLDI